MNDKISCVDSFSQVLQLFGETNRQVNFNPQITINDCKIGRRFQDFEIIYYIALAYIYG